MARKFNQVMTAERLARMDRGPLQELLALMLAATPTKARLRAWAKANPYQHARAVAMLVKPAGFADRTEALSLNLSADAVAREAVQRFGAERARQALAACGLPASLVDQFEETKPGVTVESESVEKEGEPPLPSASGA